jgi:23S rRNA pseudouridine1911/1915/1917 synthase
MSILDGQALHAKTLGFIHPTKMKLVTFESKLPMDFKKMLNLLDNLSG